MLKLLRLALSAAALSALSASAAFAGQELIIKSDETQLISLSGNPSAIVVGNPSIADATVHGNKIYVHGRAFGSTNMIVLDQDGSQLAALDITVQMNGANNVAIYKAGNRYSYTCAPLCEVAMQPGDQIDWLSDNIKANGQKSGLATGKSSADSAQAPAAQ